MLSVHIIIHLRTHICVIQSFLASHQKFHHQVGMQSCDLQVTNDWFRNDVRNSDVRQNTK